MDGFFVDHIKSFYGRWYVWSILKMGNGMYTVLFFLFHHCQHQQTPNQLIADKTLQYNQNNTDGRLGCPSTWHVYLPCPCYWSLASPHTPSVPLLSIKHFRLSMVGPYTAIPSLLGVFLVASNQLHLFASKLAPFWRKRSKTSMSFHQVLQQQNFLSVVPEVLKDTALQVPFWLEGEVTPSLVSGSFFFGETRVQSTRVKEGALKIHVCIWVEF